MGGTLSRNYNDSDLERIIKISSMTSIFITFVPFLFLHVYAHKLIYLSTCLFVCLFAKLAIYG